MINIDAIDGSAIYTQLSDGTNIWYDVDNLIPDKPNDFEYSEEKLNNFYPAFQRRI